MTAELLDAIAAASARLCTTQGQRNAAADVALDPDVRVRSAQALLADLIESQDGMWDLPASDVAAIAAVNALLDMMWEAMS